MANTVELPAGVKLGAGRETSRTNGQGQVEQGMSWPITLPSGTTTSIFVPAADLGNTAKVQSLIDDRVASIQAIEG